LTERVASVVRTSIPPHFARQFSVATHAAADLFFPRCCVLCDALLAHMDRGTICNVCWSRLPMMPAPRCTRCGHPTNGLACRWCEILPPYVRAARSVCWAAGPVGLGVVHVFKYQGWHCTARDLALRMSRLDWPRDVVEEACALIPVPLAPKREKERGFNQSERLATALAAHWQLPVWCDALSRTRYTETQTQLTPGERLRNVSGAFRSSPSARNVLRGAHVVIVDDVITTAATLNACAAALCEGGARIVSFVTFGRAPALGDRV
jgi:ComF family protein